MGIVNGATKILQFESKALHKNFYFYYCKKALYIRNKYKVLLLKQILFESLKDCFYNENDYYELILIKYKVNFEIKQFLEKLLGIIV